MKIKMAGRVTRMEEDRLKESWSAFRILIGTPTGKRPFGRPKRRLEDDTRMELKEIGIITRNWVDLVQGRDRRRAIVKAVFNLWALLTT